MNKVSLDKILVIDLEASCWRGHPPPGEIQEIIEIGAVLLDPKTGKRSDKRGILVKPTMSRISDFCTELTTLTQEQLNSGVSFAEACEILRRDYQSTDRVFVSFGDYDRKMMSRQCHNMSVRYPMCERHINVKTFAALKLGLDKEIGMIGACNALDIQVERTHHRGHDDAWNIAGIMAKCLGKDPC